MRKLRFNLPHHNRRGYLYVAVLMVTLIVSAVGFSAMSIARQMLANTISSNEVYEARLLAQAGVEYASTRWYWNPSWRTTYSNNVEYPISPYQYGNGTFTFKYVDEDGNLADTDTDAVWVYGIGRVGDTVQVQKALMLPAGDSVSSLESAFHCNGSINFGDAFADLNLNTDQFVSSNGSISVYNFLSSNSLNGDAEAVGSISGTVSGTTSTGISPRTMPGEAALEYYKLNGTPIDVSVLPINGFGNREISNAVLSANSNPYGTETNSEGIYVIDCQGANLRITDSRIVGTIVVYNVGATVFVNGSVNWEPIVSNYPALLVDARLELAVNQLSLDEATESTNFNPIGTPYSGSEDSDQVDQYPSEIRGLVYTTGELRIGSSGHPRVVGTVVSNSFDMDQDFTVNYDSAAFDNPPPGFGDGSQMRICPGSWRRVSASE